jgi:hypothetical protein
MNALLPGRSYSENIVAHCIIRLVSRKDPSHQMPMSREEHETDQTRPPTALNDIVAISKTIYRIHPHSDIFGCNNCNLRTDKWFTQEHHCRGSRK